MVMYRDMGTEKKLKKYTNKCSNINALIKYMI